MQDDFQPDPTALDPAALGAQFPPDFAWGFATSAYQIEGAADEDGRGPSIWDTFARVPGAIADGTNGDVACDHYHRYAEDVALLAGIGAANERGLDFYDRLVDTILAAGVQPLVNLFHWDLPQALQDRGGSAATEAVGWFADHTAVVVSRI